MENIKIQSTVLPDVQLTEQEWRAEFKVGILYNTSKSTDKAHQMMSLWDEQDMLKHIKKMKMVS